MRTLNKTLSLVLALVLCLGLVGSAFAANYDEYTDAEQVGEKYAEAVDVMMGTGIISGMTDTEIAPEGTLTREQAAKIIAYMLLGGKVADTLSTTEALPANIFAGDDTAAVNQPLRRQQAMLMAFNALNKGEEVETTATEYVTTNTGIDTMR